MILSVPDAFNAFNEMKHKSAITRQNQLEFLDKKVQGDMSYSLEIFVTMLIFLVKGP